MPTVGGETGGTSKKLRKKKVVKGVLKKEKTVVRRIALC